MAKPLVSDQLWVVVEPLLPPTRPAGTRGHPPVPNRVALAGIIFVLKTGIPWELLPTGDGLLWHDAVASAA
jgi:transposase